MEPTVVIRRAFEADGPVLSEIERNTPLVFDDRSLYIDRGDDYFATARLMEDAVVLLAEVDGTPAGVFCGALHGALIGGVPRRMLYVHHSRILPEYQRLGLGLKLANALFEHFKESKVDSQYWYISTTNEKSQGFARRATNRWSFCPVLVDLDIHKIAGPPAGRPATPADAPRIAAILNAAHEGEEMFLPYSLESFAARVSRAPAQYGWDRVWLTDSAVVGVWPEGESITIRLAASDGSAKDSRGAAVLDYGCLPGAEGELVSLLGAWASALIARGFDGMSCFSSPGARLARVVLTLPAEHTDFNFWTPQIPEPEGAADRGLYVDHIYF